jgi:hypothetical protein
MAMAKRGASAAHVAISDPPPPLAIDVLKRLRENVKSTTIRRPWESFDGAKIVASHDMGRWFELAAFGARKHQRRPRSVGCRIR